MARISNFALVFRPKFIVCALAQILLIYLVHYINLTDVLRENLDYRPLFRTRTLLNLEPPFHPKLKILNFDDSGTESGTSSKGVLDRWSEFLSALARRNPKAIYIDKSFELINNEKTAASFVATVRGLGVPVYAAAIFTENEIQGRRPLNLTANYGRYEALVGNQGNDRSFFAYGPPAQIFDAFRAVGHSVYQGDGRILSAVKVGEKEFLPYLALAGDNLFGDVRLPAGKFWVNTSSLATYLPQPISTDALLSEKKDNKARLIVDSGDVILILPTSLGGASEWHQGLLGAIPRGYMVASVLNSRMNGKFLYEPNIGPLLLALGWVLGTIYGLALSPLWFFIALILTTNLFRIASIASFIYGNLMIPSAGLGLTLALQGIFSFIFKMGYQLRAQILAQTELNLARTVQRTFLPQESYVSKSIEIFGFFKPANECSGDWWAHLPLGESRHILLVGDVTGHGVPAALLAASMNASSDLLMQLHRKNVLASLSASEILDHLNTSVCRVIKSELCCSLSLIDVDLSRGKLVYANAGHIPPLIIRRDSSGKTASDRGEIMSLKTLNNPLGVDPDESFVMECLDLMPGDRVIMYSDGLTEWFNRRGKRLTPAAMRKQLLKLNHTAAREIPEKLVQTAMAISAGAIQPDDITIVVLEYKGK